MATMGSSSGSLVTISTAYLDEISTVEACGLEVYKKAINGVVGHSVESPHSVIAEDTTQLRKQEWRNAKHFAVLPDIN